MTRKTIRQMLSALAALALISAFESSPALAQRHIYEPIMSGTADLTEQKPKAPKGLATRKGPKAAADIDAIDMYYSGEGSWGPSTAKPRQ